MSTSGIVIVIESHRRPEVAGILYKFVGSINAKRFLGQPLRSLRFFKYEFISINCFNAPKHFEKYGDGAVMAKMWFEMLTNDELALLKENCNVFSEADLWEAFSLIPRAPFPDDPVVTPAAGIAGT